MTKPAMIAATMIIQYWPSKAKKGKVLDQKVQRPRAPIFGAKISVTASKIYYFYIFIQQ
jgi:hypothetical protein